MRIDIHAVHDTQGTKPPKGHKILVQPGEIPEDYELSVKCDALVGPGGRKRVKTW